jgi:GTP-binding protein HflX
MLMTDTVGFIQKLPHHLVDSFKATLEEVVEADLLVHVVDASHPQVDIQIEAVHRVLDEIGALEKPMLYVFNKIDDEKGRNASNRLKHQFPKSAAVSARSGEGIERLFDELADCLKGRKVTLRLSIPLSEGKLIAALQKNASILEQEYEGAVADLLVRVSPQLAAQCRPFIIEGTDG